jgi:CDP-paratose 2-epimerase
MPKRVLVTGSSGLIGSEAITFFDKQGWDLHGIDNNMRRDLFGPDGDTTWNLERLVRSTRRFTPHNLDVRNRSAMEEIIKTQRPDLIIHCAAQPSHDLAKDRPFDDFEINAGGTLNLLEAVRRHCPESPFILMSTNKVYGDAPNELPLKETETRWDYADDADYHGISESCRVDASLHSLFGASKLAADIMVQEYGRYFNMPTVCLRGGCLTGSHHSGAELHGFLAYLARAIKEGRIYYGSKSIILVGQSPAP